MRSLVVVLLCVLATPVGGMSLGITGPDGEKPVTDLPHSLRTKNVGGRDGAGLCVFTSIGHSARFQNEDRLKDFQQKMRAELGGGYPSKVDAMIKKYGSGTNYLQHEGGDVSVLEAALAGGRMPAVTYGGVDPNYGNSRIAHMTNLVYLGRHACVFDNNFVDDARWVWMTREEFLSRWRMMGGGWCVILLQPSPPPVPYN